MYASEEIESEENKVNVLLETFKFSVFPWSTSVRIKTSSGAIKEYDQFEEFSKDYFNKIISSQAAKETLFESLKQRISSIQEKMSKSLSNWIDFDRL